MVLGGLGTVKFQGSIDDARIHDRVLPAAWIAAEYANLATPGFVTVGVQQQP